MEPYKVCVTSREVKNRIVESTVRGHVVMTDQPREFDADDTAPTPPEYLAIAYGSCLVSTMRFIAILEKLNVGNIEVTVSGEIDFSRAMGIVTASRAGFSGLAICVRFDADMTLDEKYAFVKKATERGASIDNIINPTNVTCQVT